MYLFYEVTKNNVLFLLCSNKHLLYVYRKQAHQSDGNLVFDNWS